MDDKHIFFPQMFANTISTVVRALQSVQPTNALFQLKEDWLAILLQKKTCPDLLVSSTDPEESNELNIRLSFLRSILGLHCIGCQLNEMYEGDMRLIRFPIKGSIREVKYLFCVAAAFEFWDVVKHLIDNHGRLFIDPDYGFFSTSHDKTFNLMSVVFITDEPKLAAYLFRETDSIFGKKTVPDYHMHALVIRAANVRLTTWLLDSGFMKQPSDIPLIGQLLLTTGEFWAFSAERRIQCLETLLNHFSTEEKAELGDYIRNDATRQGGGDKLTWFLEKLDELSSFFVIHPSQSLECSV